VRAHGDGTLRLDPRRTLVAAVFVFAAGHLVIALTASYALVLVARFAAAVGVGTFWAVDAVLAATVAGRQASATAMGVMRQALPRGGTGSASLLGGVLRRLTAVDNRVTVVNQAIANLTQQRRPGRHPPGPHGARGAYRQARSTCRSTTS
jgi:MFS family permease